MQTMAANQEKQQKQHEKQQPKGNTNTDHDLIGKMDDRWEFHFLPYFQVISFFLVESYLVANFFFVFYVELYYILRNFFIYLPFFVFLWVVPHYTLLFNYWFVILRFIWINCFTPDFQVLPFYFIFTFNLFLVYLELSRINSRFNFFIYNFFYYCL